MKTGTRFVLEFPAVPGILGGLALAGMVWPWWVLHGTTRWAVGIAWTVLEVLIAGVVIAAKVRQR